MIRNFIYLDSDKLRSLSSQLFEGVTEQVVSHESKDKTQSESQKGPTGSGRTIAEIFSQEGSSSELKFLEDHAYTLFEDRLVDDHLVDSFEDLSDAQTSERNFVKVTAKLQLNDLARSSVVMQDFNKTGEALWRVTNESMDSGGPKILPDAEARKQATTSGLQMNQKIADAAAYLFSFGLQNMLEANMNLGSRMFSAPLKRESLRETETLLIQKYSRLTQVRFVMVGIVTQRGGVEVDAADLPQVEDAKGLKEAMRHLATHLNVVENTFSGPAINETVIDPIAIYSVL